MTEVKCIPANQVLLSDSDNRTVRVAAYCRVSSLPQEESYESQVEHFTTYISSHSSWKLVKVYGDEGVTGLNTIKRKGFKQMISDGKKQKFDLLLVKSISRLGRNTVDLLQAVRELRTAGVSVFFEKENLSTDANVGELMLTLLSAFAQMESESISANVRIGLNYKMSRGEWSVAYSNFLGYDRIDGEVVINLEQAKTVRLIYDLFLSGYSLGQITKRLIATNRLTGAGSLKWTKGSVKRILQNRKYCGDVVLGQSVCEDLLTKHRVPNTGQAPQYLVVDGIPPIITRQMYWLAQGELERRGRMRFDADMKRYDNGFTGKLKCQCGANYNRINAKTHYVWKCHNRIHGSCKSPIVSEAELEKVILLAAQALHDQRPVFKEHYIPALSEESSPETLMKAAGLSMENMLHKRVNEFCSGPRPKEYLSTLLDLVEQIDLNGIFCVKFFGGTTISVNRQIVAPVSKPTTPVKRPASEFVTYFGVSGESRKSLVKRLAALTGEKITYLGFPSCAYMVGDYYVTSDGTIEGRLSKRILRSLARSGFEPSEKPQK